MASEKQIAANRANAMRSTGPKTAAGRLRSSRNAFRHGLSSPARSDLEISVKLDAIAHALAGKDAAGDRLISAADFTRAQFELLRIRSTRAELLATVDLTNHNLRELQRVVAVDRYERYALTKRRRASVKF
jgi:hypothetical protein